MAVYRGLQYLFATLSLFFVTGGMVVMLTPPNSTEAPAVQLLGAAIGISSFIGLIVSPGAFGRILRVYWPILLLPAFASFSLFWSVEPSLTIRRSGSLLLTTVFAFWLADTFDGRSFLKVLAAAAVMLCGLCWYSIVITPELGVHQASDLLGWEHAGAYRGSFFHKNDFGRAMALSSIVFAMAALVFARWRLIFILLYAQAIVLIVGSRSSQSLLLTVLPTVTFLLIFWLRTKSVTTRTMILASLMPLTVIAYMLSDVLFGAVLGSLGKDASLTGRTEIWSAVLQSVGHYFMAGAGFGAGWILVGDRVSAISAITVGHAHNGYLDLMLDVGLIGVAMAVGCAIWIMRTSLRELFSSQSVIMPLLALAYGVFYMVGNWAGSFLMLHNSIYWVLLVSIFCFLREQSLAGVVVMPAKSSRRLPAPAE